MRISFLFLVGALGLPAVPAWPQGPHAAVSLETAVAVSRSTEVLPDAPEPQEPVGSQVKNPQTTEQKANKEVPKSKQQPKRIFWILPNYPAVSAGAIPPPPTPKEAFKIAVLNNFDYSSFAEVGVTSLFSEGVASYPSLGKGVRGFGRYYWRGFLDKTNGNFWVIFALPTIFHQDERYFAKGEGRIWKRALYSSTRVLITPTYKGRNSFNVSEVLGRGISQAISISYYPSEDQSGAEYFERWAYAVLRDAGEDVFREFWPDIVTKVLRQKPAQP
jgi:hypothetical protein